MGSAGGASRKKAAERKATDRPDGGLDKPVTADEPETEGWQGMDQQQRLREDLISKASYGKISPEEAEAEARSAGLAPFATQPQAAEFDPMKEERWSLLQAIAWIAWRDTTLVMEQNPEYRSRYTCWFHRAWAETVGNKFEAREGWFVDSLSPPSALGLILEDTEMRSEGELPSSARFTPRQAEAELWKALLSENLKAEAFDRTDSFVEIPAGAWEHLKMYEERNQQVLKYEPLDRSAAYRNIRFKRTDVTSIWPKYVTVDTEILDLGSMTEQHYGLVLSDEAYVPFSTAVCWIATKGGLKLTSMRDESEWKKAAKTLLANISASRVDVIGCGDDAESRPLPAAAFDAVDCPHPSARDIGYHFAELTYIRCAFYSNEEDWKNGYDDQFFLRGKRQPHWTCLRVCREQVVALQPKPILKGNLEVSCRQWLEELMRRHAKRLKPKMALFDEAKERFRGLGVRQFERAWADAVAETGNRAWTKKGPVGRD